MHQKCRHHRYGDGGAKRFPVPDEHVPWSSKWEKYRPVEYTSPKILSGPSFADPDELSKYKLKFNEADGGVDRKSHTGMYDLDATSQRPMNPMGRTGVCGRGVLGRWGPNHAADPIVTRWKREQDGSIVKGQSEKAVLQAVLIRRRDNNEWALPGGMVDPGERISTTLKREFCEEALDEQNGPGSMADLIDKLFSEENGVEIYKGYVDDPRNTDNAWMETVAVNYHDEAGLTNQIHLKAGSDAGAVQWTDLNADLQLYASHIEFVKKTVDSRGAHW